MPVRLSIRQDLMGHVSKLAATHGLTVTRLVNSALVIASQYEQKLVKDAKDVKQEWLPTRN